MTKTRKRSINALVTFFLAIATIAGLSLTIGSTPAHATALEGCANATCREGGGGCDFSQGRGCCITEGGAGCATIVCALAPDGCA